MSDDFGDYPDALFSARLIKEIQHVKNYAEYIINYPNDGGLYESGKQVSAQMILRKLNQIKLERP